ncbi:MAG: PAAR domain-containing protein [Chitinophagaceae bacterium]|nr:PAAR domain-containing protein [Chitinophagaceae bacterium]
MPPAARLTDFHQCPMQTPGVPPIPHVGGPIVGPGEPTVLIGKLPAARVGDSLVCVGPPDIIVKGSSSVIIGGAPAARIGDQTAHGGQIMLGAFNVIIGG